MPVRGGVAIVAVCKPALGERGLDQGVAGGVAEHVLVGEFIHCARVAHVGLYGFAQEISGGIEREFKSLHDGVAVNLVVNAPRFGGCEAGQ